MDRTDVLGAGVLVLLLVATTTAGAQEQQSDRTGWAAESQALLATEYSALEILGVAVMEDGQGARVLFRGVNVEGRRCEGDAAIRRTEMGHTQFSSPTCYRPWGEVLAEGGYADLSELAPDCDAMDHLACGILMLAMLQHEPRPAPAYGALLAFTEPACELEQPEACAALSRLLLYPTIFGGDAPATLEQLERAWQMARPACEAGEAFACVTVAAITFADTPFSPSDPAAATALMQQQCDAGDSESCDVVEQLGGMQ